MADLHECFGSRAQPTQDAVVFISGGGPNHKNQPEVSIRSVVSEALPGKRQISLRQAALARCFGAPDR